MVEAEGKVKKPTFDAVTVFIKVAKSGKSITKINTHSIEEELEERNQHPQNP
jgi:hypothetical protein